MEWDAMECICILRKCTKSRDTVPLIKENYRAAAWNKDTDFVFDDIC